MTDELVAEPALEFFRGRLLGIIPKPSARFRFCLVPADTDILQKMIVQPGEFTASTAELDPTAYRSEQTPLGAMTGSSRMGGPEIGEPAWLIIGRLVEGHNNTC